MTALFLATALVVIAITSGLDVSAQTPQPTTASQQSDAGIAATFAIGEVKAIDPAAKQITIRTDAGALVNVVLNDSTDYKRLAPGETTLTNATSIALADVGEGDRVMARGKVSEDRKVVPARTLIVMTKGDIAKKQEAERAEWRRRGILGVIASLKPETKEITISSRSMTGIQAVVIKVNEKVEMRRYAPDSIKFGDAKPANFEELKVGDQLRALGERGSDGTQFTAEKVVTGSFRTVAGTVSAVDATTGEIKVSDLQTKQPLTIVVKHDAVLRKFPAAGEGGMMMMGGRGPGAQPNAAPRQTPPAGQTPSAQAAPGTAGGARMGGGGPNIQEMLERLPTITIAEVKVGDTIMVSSTKGADPTRLTAISLVSGADTLLNMIAARQPQAAGQSAPNPTAGLNSGIQFGIGLP